MNARRRRLRTPAGAARAILAGLALAAVTAGCGTRVASLSFPAARPASPVPSTAPPTTVDGSAVPPATVPGATTTTTTVRLGPGQATITGTVEDAGRPVPGATVLVQRLVGGGKATTEASTSAAGTWTVPGVLGGVYRIRAWSAPTLAQTRPLEVWVADGQTRTLTLRVARIGRSTTVAATWSPDPPVVGRPDVVTVTVSRQRVTVGGAVVDPRLPGIAVRLSSAGWVFAGSGTGVTGPAGRVELTATCRRAGTQPVAAVVGLRPLTLDPPACLPATSAGAATGHR